jgi:hypothetical protein
MLETEAVRLGRNLTMPTTPAAREDDLVTQLRNDLPSLASHTAVELDDLILGRAKSLLAIKELGSVMADFLASDQNPSHMTALVDPRTMVIVGRAINDSGLATTSPLTTVKDLRQEAELISKTLLSLTLEGPKPDDEALAKMRDFCLKLSKLAMASHPVGQEYRQRHPLRR